MQETQNQRERFGNMISEGGYRNYCATQLRQPLDRTAPADFRFIRRTREVVEGPGVKSRRLMCKSKSIPEAIIVPRPPDERVR